MWTSQLLHPRRAALPLLAERAHVELERPRRAILVRYPPDGVGDRVGLQEEVVGAIAEEAPRDGHVDHAVDDHVRDVDAARAETLRHRLREAPLRRLRRRER